MKLIIAGGRDYSLTARDKSNLDALIPSIECVVSGACPTGVDHDAEAWAETLGIPVVRFPALWRTHGRRAGPIRNQEMADYADALAVFPGGRGTADMLSRAKRRGLQVYDFRKGETQ